MAKEHQTAFSAQQTSLELPEAFIMPASRLDADHYAVDDLDGVTEGLFGSGNVSYASLQAAQTNQMLDVQGAAAETMAEHTVAADGGGHQAWAGGIAAGDVGVHGASLPQAQNSDAGAVTDMDRSPDQPGVLNSAYIPSDGQQVSSTVGAVGAAQFVVEAGMFGAGGSAASDGVDGRDGISLPGTGTNIINLGDTITEVTENVTQVLTELGDTITNLTTNVTDIVEVLGDTVSNLLGGDTLIDITEITEMVGDLTNELNGILEQVLEDVTELGGQVAGILDDLLDGDGAVLDELAQHLADLDVLDTVSDTLGMLGGAVEQLQASLGELTDVIGSVPGVDGLLQALGDLDDIADLAVATVDDVVGGVLDGLGLGESTLMDQVQGLADGALETVGDALADPLGAVGDVIADPLGMALDLLGGDAGGGAGDTDLSVLADTGLLGEQVDVPLDVAEELVGDIDIVSATGLDLSGDGETDNGAGDTDLTVGVDVDLLGAEVVDVPLDVTLDPVEEITGDIDLDIDAALDLLGGDGGGSADAEGDDAGWTETVIGDAAGLFGDVTDGLGGGIDPLPDPVGTVAEGLGALDVTSLADGGTGLAGGLFG